MDEGKAPGTLRVCRGEKTANYFIGVLGNLEQGLIPAEGSGDPACLPESLRKQFRRKSRKGRTGSSPAWKPRLPKTAADSCSISCSCIL